MKITDDPSLWFLCGTVAAAGGIVRVLLNVGRPLRRDLADVLTSILAAVALIGGIDHVVVEATRALFAGAAATAGIMGPEIFDLLRWFLRGMTRGWTQKLGGDDSDPLPDDKDHTKLDCCQYSKPKDED